MANYTTWNQLTKAAQAKAKKVLRKDVAPVMKETLASHIQTDILDVYTPNPTIGYTRRTTGGIDDKKTIVTEMVTDDTIMVTSIANPAPSLYGTPYHNPDSTWFFRWIEYGLVPNIFDRTKNYRWESPRPAMANTRKELANSPKLKQAIQTGLEREFN